MRGWIALLVLLVLLVTAACRDPTAGPAPRELDEPQRAVVAARTLSKPPSPTWQPPGGEVALGGGRVRYLGADVVPDPVVRGAPLTLTHYWACDRPLEQDWKVFVHLGAPGQGAVAVNGDHVPVEGLWPTSRWKAGEVYADPHTVRVPPRFPAESLEVHLGLYRFDDRLPVDRRAAHDGQNRIRLGRLPVQGGSVPLPEYRAPRSEAPITLDGVLDDPVWARAPVALLTRSDGGGSPRLRTEARLAWDDSHLYVAFHADDRDAWSTFEKDDDPLYEQEVVEVFIDADGDGRTYNELQVAPTGRRFDARFEGPRQGMALDWDSGMRAAVKVDGTVNDDSDTDEGWSVEMAIPISGLYAVPKMPPEPGDLWRFNLYRLEHHRRRQVEGSAYSPPVVPDFHRPSRFARLVFEE